MTVLRAMHRALLRWLPGWLFVSVHVFTAGQKIDEQYWAWRHRRAQARLLQLGARPRDGPH